MNKFFVHYYKGKKVFVKFYGNTPFDKTRVFLSRINAIIQNKPIKSWVGRMPDGSVREIEYIEVV